MLRSKLIMVEGKPQIDAEVIHVIVKKCNNFSKLLRSLTPAATEDPLQLSMCCSDKKSIPGACAE